MFRCALCEEEVVIISKVCESCRNIKHLMTVYSRERIYEVLNNIFKREPEKQDNKIKVEKKKEIETLQESVDNYDNKDDLLKELKQKIKKK